MLVTSQSTGFGSKRDLFFRVERDRVKLLLSNSGPGMQHTHVKCTHTHTPFKHMLREGKLGGYACVSILLVSLIDSQIYISVNLWIYGPINFLPTSHNLIPVAM